LFCLENQHIRHGIVFTQQAPELIKAIADYLPTFSGDHFSLEAKHETVAYRGLSALLPWLDILNQQALQTRKFFTLQAVKKSFEISLSQGPDAAVDDVNPFRLKTDLALPNEYGFSSPFLQSYNFFHGLFDDVNMRQIDLWKKQGKSNRGIAKLLNVSAGSIDSYIKNPKRFWNKWTQTKTRRYDPSKSLPRLTPFKQLTYAEMLAIETLLKDGVSELIIGHMFNVSRQTINVYKHHCIWYKQLAKACEILAKQDKYRHDISYYQKQALTIVTPELSISYRARWYTLRSGVTSTWSFFLARIISVG
jgi:hypothetical protein